KIADKQLHRKFTIKLEDREEVNIEEILPSQEQRNEHISTEAFYEPPRAVEHFPPPLTTRPRTAREQMEEMQRRRRERRETVEEATERALHTYRWGMEPEQEEA
ncbi:MAG: hypothetical protein IIC67_06180, partial [Thaumarchaeota archaeon]|nr:hypothetical protein [Nitrososphaerota archaeon]